MRLLLWSLLRLLILLPLWLLGLALLALGLALSPWGAGLLLQEGAKRGFYALESVEGAPLERLVLRGFELEAGPLALSAERLELAWADDCLLQGRLCIDHLAIDGARIALDESPVEEETAPPGDDDAPGEPIRLPLPIEIRSLELNDVHLRLADGTQVALGHGSTSAEAEASRLALGATHFEGLRVSLPPPPEALATATTPLSAASLDAAEEVRAPVATPGEFRFPLAIEAPELGLDDARIVLGDGTRITLEQLRTGVRAEDDHLQLLPSRIRGVALALPPPLGALVLETEEDGPARLDEAALLSAQAVQAAPSLPAAPVEEVALAERARHQLPSVTLPFRVSVPRLQVDDIGISGPIDYHLRQLALGLEAEEQTVELHYLDIASLDADARLSGRVALRDDYPLEMRLEVALWLPEHMPELASQRLTLALSGDLADLQAELVAAGPVDAQLTARADVLDPTLPFTAALDSDLLQWPLPSRWVMEVPEAPEETLDEPFLAEDVRLRVSGDLEHYTAAMSLWLEGPDVPRTRVALSGSGDRAHFAWTPLSLTLGDASVVSRGRIDWQDGLGLDATLRLDNLDPGRFTDAVHGRLSGNVDIAFVQTPDGWELGVPRLAIDGELQDLPLSLQARLAGDSDMHWSVEAFDFRQGERNRLTASGEISDRRMSLSGDIALSELAALHESLSGSLQGRFRTAGTFDAPRLELDIEGSELAFDDNRLAALSLSGNVQGLDDPVLDLRLAAAGIDAAGQRFSEVTLDLEGRLSDHQARLRAVAGPDMPLSQASLTLQGQLSEDRQRYLGEIEPLAVDTDHGELRLDDPLRFTADLAAGSAQVQPFCLRREQGGRLCLDEPLQASGEQGRMALSLQQLPMALINEWLPEEWRAGGESNLQLQVQWRQGGNQWRVDGELDSDLSLQGVDIYGQPWSLPATRLNLGIDATQARADLDVELNLADAGRLSLQLGLEDPVGEGRLQGVLTLAEVDLSRYRTLAAGVDTLEGVLSGRVAIGGTRDSPSLDGALELAGLQAAGMDIPLFVEDGRIRVEFQGDSARILGFVATDDGRLVIDGTAAWPTLETWQIAIGVDGTRRPLLVALPEFGRLRVAPNLRIRIDPSELRVRGEVQLPWARLEIGETPPAAVSPSPDEIIITRRDEARAQRSAELDERAGDDEAAAVALREAGMRLDVRIDLLLGPDMLLAASGLETGLRGTLQVRQQDGPVQLYGEVILTDGRFRAFGQDLLIRQGQLLFSGPPDQPLLDFEAIRNPDVTEDGVVAGLRVTGFAAEPSLEIFSEPAMNEASALSYLLRGRAPRDGDTDGALTSALVGLTLGQTGGAVGALGRAFGIDDLALETAGVGDESQVVVTGYLTEDLRISYGVGIFSPIAELTLRYTLWRNLYVQAVSGAAQAVDLVYIFTRPGRPPGGSDTP